MQTEIDEPTARPGAASDVPPAESPVHLARCAECGFSVHIRLLSGGGFILLDSDEALGIGDRGHPMCPDGHGELDIADDQATAAEAITEVAELIQPPLFPPPPFNFEGAYLELEALSVETDRLGRIHDDDARTAKESKKAWEAASVRRDQVALRLRFRRLEKAAPEAPEPAAAPEVSATAHVASDTVVSDVAPGDTYQPCSECGAPLMSVKTGSGEFLNRFEAGAKVGEGCPGKAATVGHHYAKRGRKKKARPEQAADRGDKAQVDQAEADA